MHQGVASTEDVNLEMIPNMSDGAGGVNGRGGVGGKGLRGYVHIHHDVWL